ncbi:arsenite transport protein ArsB [Pseudogulbenkiania sp. NH8B]|uniref:sodium:proton antiporter n=1 Tax=Pseudogulbenkiania sp. (strain NH8B) TaxID=748280 RepID=UPI000227A29C|nr:sodium:proton antiporter [Pseudogulbenkiania sp. NH8B]BAK78046.1 arsenite transport protein ArsB [Pseudogulbenkiania sp. NH8B]
MLSLLFRRGALAWLLGTLPLVAHAGVNGAELTTLWAVPFAGLLLSIAILPLLAPGLWHHHFGKIAAGWALLFIVPFALQHGGGATGHELLHTLLLEYLPFIILLVALFTVAGGIYLRGNLHGSPLVNTTLLGIGTVLASFTGTTGASMLLIRPLLRANDNRRHKTHVVVFFIFLVANIGGSLTPLGDPPLFLGFLKGVSFGWTLRHLLPLMAFASVILLVLFYLLDRHYYHKEENLPPLADPTPDSKLRLEGSINLLLLGAIVGAVLLSGTWKPGINWTIGGLEIELQSVVRDVLLLGIAALSLALTPGRCRAANAFNWGPMLEVAKLFAGIFVTMIPVLAMLKAGSAGAFGNLVAMVNDGSGAPLNPAYFWLTGALSSFLDNAPTYLVFFNLAGGEPGQLMTTLAPTLTAISAGAVFMGANSYIGNAPNFMVKAIAEERGVAMPSFFGYIGWSLAILIPVFLLVTLLFF